MGEDRTWALRNPDGGAHGLDFALAVTAAHDVVLAHALPERVDVLVYDDAHRLLAQGRGLHHPDVRPMSRLVVDGGTVRRENVWPGEEDLGRPVILCGGEVGVLLDWWHAPDGSEWRWRVEFANRAAPE